MKRSQPPKRAKKGGIQIAWGYQVPHLKHVFRFWENENKKGRKDIMRKNRKPGQEGINGHFLLSPVETRILETAGTKWKFIGEAQGIWGNIVRTDT